MESERKRGRVGLENGEIVDLNDKTVTYVKDLINLPSVTYGDVMAYLSTNCEWTHKRIKAFKMTIAI